MRTKKYLGCLKFERLLQSNLWFPKCDLSLMYIIGPGLANVKCFIFPSFKAVRVCVVWSSCSRILQIRGCSIVFWCSHYTWRIHPSQLKCASIQSSLRIHCKLFMICRFWKHGCIIYLITFCSIHHQTPTLARVGLVLVLFPLRLIFLVISMVHKQAS